MNKDEQQVNDGNGKDRFKEDKDGNIIDREIHPKVLKAQTEEQKKRSRIDRRKEQRQR